MRIKAKKPQARFFVPLFIILAIIFSVILFSTFRNMLKESIVGTVIFLLSLAIIFFLFRHKLPKISDKTLLKIQISAHILSLIFMILVAIYGAVEISWDWGAIVNSAGTIALKNYNPLPDYFYLYPNNHFWLSFLTLFLTSCKSIFHITDIEGLKIASVVLGIIIIRLTYIFIFLNSEKAFGSRRARIIDIILLFFIPLYLYAPFAYTDTSAMLLVSILIYLYLTFKEEKPQIKTRRFWLLALFFALIIAILSLTKIMALIVVIAMLLTELIDKKSSIKYVIIKYSGIIVSAVIFALLLNLPTSYINKLDLSQLDNYRLPPTHWIMMSLNDTGQYSQMDLEYTKKFKPYTAKKTATQDEIVKRLKDRGFLGTVGHIFNVKISKQWGESLLAGDDFISRHPLHPDSFVQKFFGLKRAKDGNTHHWLCLAISWPYFMLLILGCALSLLFSYKNRAISFTQITIIGVFLFFIIWEVWSRYLVVFLPTIVICSTLGWLALKEKLSLKRR